MHENIVKKLGNPRIHSLSAEGIQFILSVKCGSRKSDVKAAPLPCNPGTFDPDVPAHRFYQMFADVEAQTCSPDGTGQVPFQPDEFPKEQRNVLRRNPRSGILHTDAYLRKVIGAVAGRITSRGYNPYGSLGRSIFEGVGEQIAQHLVEELAIGLDGKPFSNLQVNGVLLSLWL